MRAIFIAMGPVLLQVFLKSLCDDFSWFRLKECGRTCEARATSYVHAALLKKITSLEILGHEDAKIQVKSFPTVKEKGFLEKHLYCPQLCVISMR